MYNLIAKDILIQKKQVLFAFVYILFILVAFQSLKEAMYPAGIVAFTYMILMSACAFEDKNKTDIMLNSLPLRRGIIVLAKYISVFVFFIMGTVAYFILTYIIRKAGIPLETYPITIEALVGGIAGVCFISGLYFPVFFKLGYAKSKIFNFILFFIFFFGVTYLVRLIRINLNKPILKEIARFAEAQPDAVMAVISIAAVLLFFGVSYFISVRFYKNREF